MHRTHRAFVHRQRPRARSRGLLALLGFATVILFGLAAPAGASVSAGDRAAHAVSAAADGCSGTAIDKQVKGRLVDTGNSGAALAGARLIVTNCEGQTFEGTTGDDGTFVIDFQAALGKTTIELDTSTLPEGVKLREGASAVNDLSSFNTSSISTTFRIGPDNRHVETKWDRVPALIYSGLSFGLILALGALGLSMIFGTTGLTNFAHGELLTFGALVTWVGNTQVGLPMPLAVVSAVLLGMVLGWVQDTGLWRPLRRRGTGLIAAMIVSIGLQFFLRYLFAYITGSRQETYDDYWTPEGHDFHGLFTYTYRDVVISLTCLVVLLAVTLALAFTRLGRATRAVADNPALAASTGINVDRVISLVWIIGTGLAALSGAFAAFQLGVTFTIGQLTLLLLFSACCIGGLGSVWGAMVGALIIGVLIDLSTLVIPGELKNAGALFLLIIILLVRPQGLLGRRERIG